VIFDELVKDYLDYSKANHRSYKRSVTIAKVLLRFLGAKRLSEISSFDVERYKVDRKKDEVALSTINRELTVLKRMFNLAIEWEATNTNPVKGVKFFTVKNKPMDIFSKDDFAKLHNSASPHLKPILICAISTGMRASEIFNLKWRDVNISDESITVRDTKNSDYRVIPINLNLKKTLLVQSEENENSCEYVFLYNGEKIQRVDKSFKTAIRKAGIKKFRFHDLRHTFATRLVMKGVDLVTVKELLGHKSIIMTQRYSHPTPEHKKRAVNIVNIEISFDTKVLNNSDTRLEDLKRDKAIIDVTPLIPKRN